MRNRTIGGADAAAVRLPPRRWYDLSEGHRVLYIIGAMRRLDFYILRELHGPFWLALLVILVVLVTDFVPDVVRMVVSKGLPLWIILQVFVLNLAWMTALAIPMAVLSGTLMAFGRLAADSETLAMKAAGISLYRLTAPVLLAAMLLAAGLVVFNNEVLPDANHKARRLMADIKRKRPTLDLKANVMEDRIPGFHLLIKQLDETSSDIADITIFDPQTVTDRATYENPRLTSVGIQHVLVNGQFVIKEQALVREALPGKPVRGPVR